MTIEQRVAKLEKQNRWMKRVGGLALAGVACVVLIGQGKAKELPDLVARSLTIKDPKGRTRISLGLREDQGGSLRLFDSVGRERAGLSTTANGDALLILQDKDGGARVMLSFAKGDSALHLLDKEGDGAWLRTSDDARTLQLRGGKASVVLGVLATGLPSLYLLDKLGKQRALLGVTNGSPSLSVYDSLGKRRLVLGVSAGDSPSLHLYDKTGMGRAALGVTAYVNKRTGAETKTAESALTMYNAKGNVIWQAPK